MRASERALRLRRAIYDAARSRIPRDVRAKIRQVIRFEGTKLTADDLVQQVGPNVLRHALVDAEGAVSIVHMRMTIDQAVRGLAERILFYERKSSGSAQRASARAARERSVRRPGSSSRDR